MDMTATIVHVWVKPEHIDDFIEATEKNHRASILEKGNLRFDVLRDRNDPNKFTLYEAYRSDEEAAAHKKTTHYAEWRDTVESYMHKPREGVAHMMLFPQA